MQNMLRLINKADNPAELWRVVRKYYRKHGFSAVAYYIPRPAGTGNMGSIDVVAHGFSAELAAAYIDEGTGRADPVPQFTMQQGMPLRWSEIWAKIDADVEQTRFLELMRELELGDGYAMPVFGPMHCHGTVSIGRAVNPEVLDTAPVAELHMVAQAAHMRLCALMPDLQGPEKRLSAREQEILDWVARGKSNNDIASIVGLSTGTVDTYLRRIYDKLGVSDRTSAAVRGVGMGLIIAK